MKKLTHLQIAFLVAYPIFHVVLSIIFFFIKILMVGIAPDTPEELPSHGQLIIANICDYALNILSSPIYFLDPPGHVYFWLGLNGLLYGCVILFLYKLIRKK